MPFYLYDVTVVDGKRQYSVSREISLAGSTGPLANIATKSNMSRQIPFPWHAGEKEIVSALGGTVNQRVVIDLKPNVVGNVSLYRLLDVWGYSTNEFTPVALRLQSIFVDQIEADPITFKKSFDDVNAKRELIGEFLYLNGGVDGGRWTWGLVGRVNGALLWKDAFDHLARNLSKALGETIND